MESKLIKKLVVLLLVITVTGCSDENDGSVSREFFANTSLTILQDDPYLNFRLDDGQSLLFRYSLNYPDEPNIADDEVSDVFWFEIPTGQTSFSFDLSQDVDTLPMLFQRVCFCAPISYTFRSVSITGKQLNVGEWQITFDMQALDSDNTVYPLRDEGVYKLSTF